MKRLFLSVVGVMIAILIVLFSWYLAVGSLEMWATPEKTSGVRIACAWIILNLFAAETAVVIGLIKAFKK